MLSMSNALMSICRNSCISAVDGRKRTYKVSAHPKEYCSQERGTPISLLLCKNKFKKDCKFRGIFLFNVTIIIIIIIIISLFREIFLPELADGFSLEFKW